MLSTLLIVSHFVLADTLYEQVRVFTKSSYVFICLTKHSILAMYTQQTLTIYPCVIFTRFIDERHVYTSLYVLTLSDSD